MLSSRCHRKDHMSTSHLLALARKEMHDTSMHGPGLGEVGYGPDAGRLSAKDVSTTASNGQGEGALSYRKASTSIARLYQLTISETR